jgi:hypothetical protein
VRIAPGFEEALRGYDLGELAQQRDTVFGLSADRRLAFVNPAWDRFARDNGAKWPAGAWDLGASIDAAIPEPLRPLYDALYASARQTGEPVDHEYECSTPSAIRRLRMRVYPLRSEGWLVVNALVADGVDPGPVSPASLIYVGDGGVVLMCSHCRRTRRADASAGEQWDWVADYVETMPVKTSHGLCAACFAHHYPNDPDDG